MNNITKLLIISVVLLSISITYSSTHHPLPLLGKVIYIDSGHGGKDPGTSVKNILEKDITLAIAKKLDHRLTSLGAITYMTRDADYDLSAPQSYNIKRNDLTNRINLINELDPDLYISIHVNSYPSSKYYGAGVYYDEVNPENKIIAEIMQSRLKEDLESPRSVKKLRGYYLFRSVKAPGILVEVGFMSNPNERGLLVLPRYQQRLSNTIARGIIDYHKNRSILIRIYETDIRI